MRHNKTIVVTGGSKGIGRAIIENFMEEGFDIITCSRNKTELQQLKTDLESEFPAQTVHIMAADLSEEKFCMEFGQFVLSITECPDVLINNTGHFIPGQISSEEPGVLESMLKSNLLSAYYVTRSILPSFIQAGKGHIFTICSTASIIPYINGGSYCISKFALYGFTKVLREELKDKNIRVTSVLPGATLTASWDGIDLPDTRFIKPDDIGKAVLSCWKLSTHAVVEEILIRPQLGDI